jgi:hypothetical protein
MRTAFEQTLLLRHGVLRAVFLALSLTGLVGTTSCAPSADQVELRLFPCDVGGMEPRSVVVEITGFDGEGAMIETFEVGFDGIAAQVFEDGYATVGYRNDPDVVTATIRVGWFDETEAGTIAAADAVVEYESLMVPAFGQVLTLSADGDCSPIAGDGDGDNTGDGDGDGDNTGDGDGDGDNTGDGDGDGDGDPIDPCESLEGNGAPLVTAFTFENVPSGNGSPMILTAPASTLDHPLTAADFRWSDFDGVFNQFVDHGVQGPDNQHFYRGRGLGTPNGTYFYVEIDASIDWELKTFSLSTHNNDGLTNTVQVVAFQDGAETVIGDFNLCGCQQVVNVPIAPTSFHAGAAELRLKPLGGTGSAFIEVDNIHIEYCREE